MMNPFVFARQVRQEVSKVTWPTRNETVITTIMVMVMVFIMAFFFLGVDQILSRVIRFILSY
jgi:preprotein translocase subunit SecE